MSPSPSEIWTDLPLVFARVTAASYCDCKPAGDRVLRMIGSISHQAKSLPTRLLLSHPPSHHLPEMQGDAKGSRETVLE